MQPIPAATLATVAPSVATVSASTAAIDILSTPAPLTTDIVVPAPTVLPVAQALATAGALSLIHI